MAGCRNHGCGGSLRCKAVDWLQSHHMFSKRLDNAPAAHRCAGRHRQRANNFDPCCDFELRGHEELKLRRKIAKRAGAGGRKQRQRYHAHGLLRVVGSVTESHESGGRNLQLAEGAIDRLRTQ